MKDGHGFIRTHMCSSGGHLVKFIATLAATSEAELLSPIRPADRPYCGQLAAAIVSPPPRLSQHQV